MDYVVGLPWSESYNDVLVIDTPGLAPSPKPPLLDWPSKTGPSAGTGIVATPCVFPFLLSFPVDRYYVIVSL